MAAKSSTAVPPIAGYYAILDVRASGALAQGGLAAELARAAELLAAGPCCLQLRAKGLFDGPLLELARALLPLCQRAGVPFCLNDRADLAYLAGADLLHVGQDDLALPEVRAVQAALGASLPVGVSTHNLSQVEAAAAAGAHYLGFGPVFPTLSKQQPDPVVGLEGLRAACRLVDLPVVAIGGITRATLAAVIDAGAAAAAVIGDIDASGDRTRAGRAVAAAFATNLREQHHA